MSETPIPRPNEPWPASTTSEPLTPSSTAVGARTLAGEQPLGTHSQSELRKSQSSRHTHLRQLTDDKKAQNRERREYRPAFRSPAISISSHVIVSRDPTLPR
jgi:hypothetical protein